MFEYNIAYEISLDSFETPCTCFLLPCSHPYCGWVIITFCSGADRLAVEPDRKAEELSSVQVGIKLRIMKPNFMVYLLKSFSKRAIFDFHMTFRLVLLRRFRFAVICDLSIWYLTSYSILPYRLKKTPFVAWVVDIRPSPLFYVVRI